jgi:hypothetical protein
MHPDTREVAEHMRGFGMAILGRATYDLTFSEMMAPYKHAMAVGHAAHGAEIVLKARIAQEHPLLLFSHLPKSTNAQDQLTISELFEYGRTVQYNELPEVLWAATGIRMSNVKQYQDFGKLRNSIIHFAVPDVDYHDEALKFLFEVMEPLTQSFWGLSIVPYAGIWDEYVWEDDGLRGQLDQAGVTITADLDYVLERSNYDYRTERYKPRPTPATPPAPPDGGDTSR